MSADRVLIFEDGDPRHHAGFREGSTAHARYPETEPSPAPDPGVQQLPPIRLGVSPFYGDSPALTSPFFRPAPGPDSAPAAP